MRQAEEGGVTALRDAAQRGPKGENTLSPKLKPKPQTLSKAYTLSPKLHAKP